MTEGPRGRLFGFKPYSSPIRAFGSRLKLATVRVQLRDGPSDLDEQLGATRRTRPDGRKGDHPRSASFIVVPCQKWIVAT